MRKSHPGLGQVCLLILVLLAACESPGALRREPVSTNATGAVGAAESTSGPGHSAMPQAIEEMLLHEIARRICPFPEEPDSVDPYERYFTSEDPAYSFICYPAAGHSITVTLRRFTDRAQSEAGFRSTPELGPVEELDGLPISDWQEQHPSFPGGRYEYRVRLLQVGPWLIGIRSFDDTHFLIAPDPREASIAVLEVLEEHGLLPIPSESP